jgi:hypothetical protein
MDLFQAHTATLLQPFFRGLDRADTFYDVWDELDARRMIEAGLVKPMGTDAISRALARLYLGNGREIIVQELMKRYPRSWEKMPVAPLAYPRLWARSDSGAYAQPATRYLVDGEGATLDADAPLGEAFGVVLDKSRHDEKMQEAELRAMCGVRTVFVHVGYFPATDGEPGYCTEHIYWPHDVAVVTLPTAPSEEGAIVFVALRQTAPGMREQWLLYKRDLVTAEDGTVDLLGWQTAVYTAEQGAVTWQEYAGKLLPVVALRIEQPDGGFWPAPNHDAYHQSVGLNVNRANMEQVTDLQAHSLMAVSSDTYDEREQPVGPDAVMKLRAGENAQWITPSPAFDAMRENIDEKQRAIATVNGNNPNAYSAKATQPESGIARIIANLPHEQRLKQLRPVVKRFDERVCRVLLDVSDAFDDEVPLFGEVVRPRVELGQTPMYEDPEVKQRRALIDLEKGVMTLAEYAVEVGRYSSIDDAVADGIPNERRAAASAGAAPRSGGGVMDALLAGVDVEREDAPAVEAEAPAVAAPAAEAQAITVNELTLGIERLGRLGDMEGLNALRAKLAAVLGVPAPAPIESGELAEEAEVVNDAIGTAPRRPGA